MRENDNTHKRVVVSAIMLTMCLSLALVMTTKRVSANTFTVMNLNDSGPGSLRQAILDANANAGADTINFQAGLSGTITLTSGELLITGDLTILGPGSASLTISGNNTSRVFVVATTNVTISGLTISNAKVGDFDFGGGIANLGGMLAVTNCILSGNIAVNFSTDSSCPGFTVVTSAQLNLGPLQVNPPGTTATHALLAGSVAIDAVMDCTDLSAIPAPVTTDQRGVIRPQDGDNNGIALCDAGAYEAPPCTSEIVPPQITCPANVTAVTAITCPPSTGAVATFPPPTASDNCPGVSVACSPASGSTFPVGTTTVTCTATD